MAQPLVTSSHAILPWAIGQGYEKYFLRLDRNEVDLRWFAFEVDANFRARARSGKVRQRSFVGRACAPVTIGCLAGVGAKAVGNGGRAVSVAIDNDAEAKVDNMAKGGVEFPLAPSVSEFL